MQSTIHILLQPKTGISIFTLTTASTGKLNSFLNLFLQKLWFRFIYPGITAIYFDIIP